MSKHTYYRLMLKLASPLALGSGKNDLSDHDCVRHNNGSPFIPASSIAGVFRHYFDKDITLQKALFGSIENGIKQSGVIFYDAELRNKSVLSIRDSVKLKNKVGVDGAKFDMEIVETGAEFVTFIELEKDYSSFQKNIEDAVAALGDSILRFGAKTSRGYGMVEICSLKKAEFDLDIPEETEKWLNFDIFDDNSWVAIADFAPHQIEQDSLCIKLLLRQKGAVSVRVYTTEISSIKKNMPDYKHITLRNGAPVIPGTSWAGAFRERYDKFAGKARTDALFGFVEENTGITQRSRIQFSESVIKDYVFKDVTRNSIDRFSANTKDGALYTERTCYYGTTELVIIVTSDISDVEKKCLSAVISDLNNGFLAVGGLTSVGHGLFTIQKIIINGKDKSELLDNDNLYDIWR